VKTVKEGEGRFQYASKGMTGIVYIPSDLVKDSTFPFQENEQVNIRIEGKRLIVEKNS
jgi:hypothetical protein